jgi:acyl-CoA synthetase (AMP-forming)/AMP-acid ligase II
MIRWWAREKPQLPCLRQGADEVSYADFSAWVGRVAALFADEGVGIGDRVCIHGVNCMEWSVAAFATLRCGGVFAGLSNKMVMAEVTYLLGDYSPVILVSDDEAQAKLETMGPLEDRHGAPVKSPLRISFAEIAALREGEVRDVRREVDPNALAYIVTTSGSTARPKGVMFSNHSLIDHVAAFRFEDPVADLDPKMYVVAPFNTTAGGMLMMHSLIQGGTCYIADKFDAAEVLEAIVRDRISIFCAAPIFLQRIAELPEFADADVSCIKVSFTGGAAVPMKLLKAWADKGVLVRQMYGQSEMGGWGTVTPPRLALEHPDKCGFGGPLRDNGIIDEDGNFLGPNEMGQIVMRGPGSMLGYWNDPEATARTMVDGWIRTGDLGVIDENGMLRFVDRLKDIIISGGLNISAAEIERVLMEFPGIEETAVIAAPDEKFGETPLAVVYSQVDIDVVALIEHCNLNLSGYKVPRYVAVHKEPLERLAAGKISKPVQRARYSTPESLPPRVR